MVFLIEILKTSRIFYVSLNLKFRILLICKVEIVWKVVVLYNFIDFLDISLVRTRI